MTTPTGTPTSSGAAIRRARRAGDRDGVSDRPGLSCARTPPTLTPGAFAGVSVVALDRRATGRIRNDTGSELSYRVSGWETARLDGDCIGILAIEVERGPIAAHAVVEMTISQLDERPEVPVTVQLWAHRCGEALHRSPFATLPVVRSLVVPASI